MSVSKYKTWLANEVLTSADLNASFDQLVNNQQDFGWPRTSSADLDGQTLIIDSDADSSLRATSDDVVALRLQGTDLYIFDGDGASASCGIRFTAGTTSSTVSAQGSATDIGLTLESKGAGNINLTGGNAIYIAGKTFLLDVDADSHFSAASDDVLILRLQGVDQFIFDGDAASVADGFTFRGAASGTPPEIAAQGSSTNIDVKLTPKGSGVVRLGSSVVTATPTATAVPIAGGAGQLDVGWIPGPVKLASYAPSGAASVDITSVISATYNRYEIYFNLRTNTDSDALFLRTDESNGASFDSANYAWAANTVTTTPASTASGSASTSAIVISANTANIGNATNEGISGRITLQFVGSASMFPIITWQAAFLNPSTVLNLVTGAGSKSAAAAINAVQLIMSSGTVTGAVDVFGYKA